nr:LptF/LptG family permease [Petrachloros mirabilis]
MVPQLSRLDRYLIQELSQPFWVGVGLFSALGVSVGALFELLQPTTEVSIPLSILLQLLALQTPYFVCLSLPIAMLWASLLTFSQLSTDGELTALRACGISLGRLMVTTTLLSCLVASSMWLLNESLVPMTQHRAQQLFQASLEGGIPQFLPQQQVLYPEKSLDGQVNRWFYARERQGQSLLDLTLLDLTHPDLLQIISADSATWDAQTHTWIIHQGILYGIPSQGHAPSLLTFQEQHLPQYSYLSPITPVPESLSTPQMHQYITHLEQQNELQQVQTFKTRLQQRYALLLTPMLMTLLGTFLGASHQNLSTTSVFGLSAGIVLLYYLLLFLGEILGHIGLLSPMGSAWLGNGILGSIGIGSWLKTGLQTWARSVKIS